MAKAKTEQTEEKTMKSSVGNAINKKASFDLEGFKKSKNLQANSNFKKQEWIPLSPAFNEIIGLPGIPKGHISLCRGKSDTGKSTAYNETVISAQKLGILPILIITEMKFSMEHLIEMGFDAKHVVDEETGELSYVGNFIYVDRSSLNVIEDVAAFIADILDEQKKGKLPVDLLFAWDSIGSLPSQQSVDAQKNNPLWNAGAMAMQFGNYINQLFPLSRKKESKYTNTFFGVQKTGVDYQIGVYGGKPRRTNAHGDAMFWDASLVVSLGNITNSGTSKVTATRDGKSITFAKITKIAVDKNHITNATTDGRIVMTTHGFIRNTDSDINKYKKEHKHEWVSTLGEGEVEVIQENVMEEASIDSID